jgi:hypothetical protein
VRTKRHIPRCLVSLLSLAVLLAGCSSDVKPEIVAGVDACSECNMIIDTPAQACGFVDGSTFVTFDSPACLLRNYETRRRLGQETPAEVYFADFSDASLHPASAVTFVFVDNASTVMESGVLCFADREAAEAAARSDGGRITDWQGYQLARGTPDRVVAVRFEATGMIPEMVESSKGELLLWNASASGLDHDLVVSIKGYPEVGEITIPASGDEVSFRMKAARPGTGFPVVELGSDNTVGVLRVLGAHTADEEAR